MDVIAAFDQAALFDQIARVARAFNWSKEDILERLEAQAIELRRYAGTLEKQMEEEVV